MGLLITLAFLSVPVTSSNIVAWVCNWGVMLNFNYKDKLMKKFSYSGYIADTYVEFELDINVITRFVAVGAMIFIAKRVYNAIYSK